MTIAATLDLAEAGNRIWAVIVVGAGPAGAMAAREVARLGESVLLVDKAAFPRWKVCGCCLNFAALESLQRTGLGQLCARQRAVRLQDVLLASGSYRALISLPGGVALSRESLDAALVEAAIQAGAAFLPATHATLERVPARRDKPAGSESGRHLLLRQNDRVCQVAASLVIAADGLAGRLLSREGDFTPRAKEHSRVGAGVVAESAPAFYGRGRIYMACGAGGYVGLVRVENGQLNIAAAFDRSLLHSAGGPGKAAAGILSQVGWPAIDRLSELAWRGTMALTQQPLQPVADRVLVLGDAAGYVEPFTGEGIAWALASGLAVAPLAVRAIHDWQPALGEQWAALHGQIVARRQYFCRIVAQVLRHPALVQVLIALLGRMPALANPVVRRLNAPFLTPR
jgi:flavin-dependent dehydrogenase